MGRGASRTSERVALSGHGKRYTQASGNGGLPASSCRPSRERSFADAAALDGNADEHEASLHIGASTASSSLGGAAFWLPRFPIGGPCNGVLLRVLPLPVGQVGAS
jgi:hypothetical protein